MGRDRGGLIPTTVLSLPPARPGSRGRAGRGRLPLRSMSTASTVLDCFAEEAELGATRVAARLGIAKSTAADARALATDGLLERTRPGATAWACVCSSTARSPSTASCSATSPCPRWASFRASARDDPARRRRRHRLFYVERTEAASMNVRFRSEHRRNPAHSSSTGRVLAAGDPRWPRRSSSAGSSGTRRSGGRPAALPADPRDHPRAGLRDLARGVRARLVLHRGADHDDARRRPHPVAALSVVAPTSRVLGHRKPAVVQGIRRAAARVSRTWSAPAVTARGRGGLAGSPCSPWGRRGRQRQDRHHLARRDTPSVRPLRDVGEPARGRPRLRVRRGGLRPTPPNAGPGWSPASQVSRPCESYPARASPHRSPTVPTLADPSVIEEYFLDVGRQLGRTAASGTGDGGCSRSGNDAMPPSRPHSYRRRPCSAAPTAS